MYSYSHLIETHNLFPNKLLVCDIQVKEEELALGDLCIITNKWMQLEQWLEFEHQLQLIIKSMEESTLDEFVETTLYLSSAARVVLRHSSKSTNSFKDLIEKSYAGDAFILEIVIDRMKIKSLKEKQKVVKAMQTTNDVKNMEYTPTTKRSKKVDFKSLEYVPYKPSSSSSSKLLNENGTSESNESNIESLDGEYLPTLKRPKKGDIRNGQYVPYKPSSSQDSNIFNGDSISEVNEPYSPKPVYDASEGSSGNIDESPLNSNIPTYKPSRIRRGKKKLYTPSAEASQATRIEQESIKTPTKGKHLLNISPDENQKTSSESGEKNKISNDEQRSTTNENVRKQKNRCKPTTNEIVSSKCFVMLETSSALKSKKNLQIPPKTPEIKTKRTKCERNDENYCMSEKKTMQGWLCTKNIVKKSGVKIPKPRPNEKKTHLSKTLEKKEEDSIHSAEEDERQIVALQLLREQIGMYKKPTPEKIQMLNLNHLSTEEILSTFSKFETVLDEVFEKNHKNTKITGYNGIDHIKTITLLDNQKQLKMMSFLQSHYQPNEKGVPTLTNLFSNAILPEWIICVFMNEYDFTRDEALIRLNAQEDYAVYLERDLELSRDF